jgi:glucokinase-like ROK family protein
MAKATQQQTKEHNTRLVLKTIYDQDRISRAEVARSTRLTKTTVSSIVSDLIEDNLVKEAGIGYSNGGKPPILLTVLDDGRHYIGIDLANSVFRGAIVNLRGEITDRFNIPIENRDGESALELVYELIETLLGTSSRSIHGIGIGTPGLMNPEEGVVLNAVNLDWKDLPLAEILKERYHFPIYIANDSQVAALAEFTFGTGEIRESLFLIKLGRGIGSGIVIKGNLYYGDEFGAGEIGHVVVNPNGDPCRCGNFGCLETLVSSRALNRQARMLIQNAPDSIIHSLITSPEEINTDLLWQAYQKGDLLITNLIAQAGETIGKALAHTVATLNINTVVVSGSLSRFGEGIRNPIEMGIRNAVLPAIAQKTKVELSNLDEEIVILGAASLLLKNELGVV